MNQFSARFYKTFKIIILLLIAGFLNSCSGSATASNNSTVNLGTAPNGSVVMISSNSFSISPSGNTSATISISGGTPNTSTTINFNNISFRSNTKILQPNSITSSASKTEFNGITITTIPNVCTLGTVGTNLPTSCQVNISTSDTTLPGTYLVTPIATNNTGDEVALNAITIVVQDIPPTPTPGNLAISTSASSINIGQQIAGTLSLNGSIDASNVTVTLSTTDSSIAVSPNSCILSTSINSCPFSVTGIKEGNAAVIATALNYNNAVSANITVASSIIPGNLILSLSPNSVGTGESSIATVTLKNAKKVSMLTVFMNAGQVGDTGNASISGTASCIIQDSENNNSCSINLNAGTIPGYTTIIANATNYSTSTAVLSNFQTSTLSAILTQPESNVVGVAGINGPIELFFTGMVESTTVSNSTIYVGTAAGESNISATAQYNLLSNQQVIDIYPQTRFLNNESVYITILAQGVLDAESGLPIPTVSFKITTQKTTDIIYLTESAFNGNLKSAAHGLISVGSTGIQAADALCANDTFAKTHPHSQVKAIISDGVNRYPYTIGATPTSVDWPINSNQVYSTLNQNNITMSSFALLQYFSPDLTNYLGISSVIESGTPGVNQWDGYYIMPTYLPDSIYVFIYSDGATQGNSCMGWTSESNIDNGVSVGPGPAFNPSTPCDTALQLACVLIN